MGIESFFKKSSMVKNLTKHPAFFIIIIVAIYYLPISGVKADMHEKDIGIPLYPGSKQIPSCVSTKAGQNLISFQNITLITSDSFKKVLTFYQEKLGRFSTSKSQAFAKSAFWSESTAKGYRIVTLLEAGEGTKITITKRIW